MEERTNDWLLHRACDYLAAFCSDCSGSADGEPFCGAGNPEQDGASFGGAQGILLFPAEGLGLQLLVGKVGLGGAHGLAKEFISPSLDNFIPEAHFGVVAALPLEGAH